MQRMSSGKGEKEKADCLHFCLSSMKREANPVFEECACEGTLTDFTFLFSGILKKKKKKGDCRRTLMMMKFKVAQRINEGAADILLGSWMVLFQ